MADQREEVKKKIDIVGLISEYLPLKKAGRNFKGLCPFHSEKTPSFIVSPERQIWHCFGACNTGGDIFSFLMKIENIEFGEALRILAKRAGVKLTSYQPTNAEKQKRLLYEVNHLTAEFYHYILLRHPAGKPGLDYLRKRGINSNSLQVFNLGFAPQMWDGLQKFLVTKKGYSLQILEKAGLIIRGQRGFYDRFRGRIMFPLTNHRGDVCGFAGRTLDPTQKQAKYVNTPETLIYHKSDLLYGLSETKKAIRQADGAILVEGELDAISSFQAGIKNVVAIKGSALSSNQIQRLGFLTQNIIFALDADLAGNQAARRGIELADQAGMNISVVEIKGGKDPDEVAQKDPKQWQKLVQKAVPVYDYFLDLALAKFNPRTAEGKRKIGQEMIPILAKINDEIVRSHYIQILAENLAVPETAIMAEIEKVGKASPISKTPLEDWTKEEETRREILEEHLLGLCFQAEEWPHLRKRIVLNLIKTPRLIRILAILAKYLRKYKTYQSERLAKMMPPEIKPGFNKLYLLDMEDLIKGPDEFQREWKKTLSQLEKLDLKQKLEELTIQIKNLEAKKPLKREERLKLKKLGEKFRRLCQKL